MNDYTFPARAPHFLHAERLSVDVRVVWRVSRVVSGIRADTVSDERPRVDRRGLYAIGGRLCVPLLGCPTIVARDVCYADVRAVWGVSHVVSGIRADTVSDEQPNVDRRGLSEIERRLYVPSIGRHFIVTLPVSSAASRLISFPTYCPMSIDAGCGSPRVGPHYCSVYLDDNTLLSLGRCTSVACGFCFVDAQAVQFFFRVGNGIGTTTVVGMRPHVV
jgi:hypothetical protein